MSGGEVLTVDQKVGGSIPLTPPTLISPKLPLFRSWLGEFLEIVPNPAIGSFSATHADMLS